MFKSSNHDPFAASSDEAFPETPRKNSNPPRMTFFSPRTLNGDFRFSPSAWKTPESPHTMETPLRLGTPHAHHASPPRLFGTPGAYYATVSLSKTPRGTSGVSRSPMGNIGVTPARIMGPFPRRDLLFETTPSPSPISVVAQRKIYTPKRLQEKQARKSLEEREGTDLLDASLFGMAGASPYHRTTPSGQFSASYTDPGTLEPAPAFLALSIPSPPAILPPLDATYIESNVGRAGRTDVNNGNERNEDESEDEGEDNGEDSDGDGESDSEPEGAGHHPPTLTDCIHSQHGAQNGSTADDGNVWLPFPYNRDNLVMYLEEGLSLRHLFPSSIQGERIRCEAELELVGGSWRHTEMCHESEGSAESYQRHIKSKHLGVKRGKQVGLGHIVNTVWNYNKTLPKQPRTWLRIQRWDPHMPGFPLVV